MNRGRVLAKRFIWKRTAQVSKMSEKQERNPLVAAALEAAIETMFQSEKHYWARDARSLYWELAVTHGLADNEIRVYRLFLKAYLKRRTNLASGGPGDEFPTAPLWFSKTGVAKLIRAEAKDDPHTPERWGDSRNETLLKILNRLQEAGAIVFRDTNIERQLMPECFPEPIPRRVQNPTHTYQPALIYPNFAENWLSEAYGPVKPTHLLEYATKIHGFSGYILVMIRVIEAVLFRQKLPPKEYYAFLPRYTEKHYEWLKQHLSAQEKNAHREAQSWLNKEPVELFNLELRLEGKGDIVFEQVEATK